MALRRAKEAEASAASAAYAQYTDIGTLATIARRRDVRLLRPQYVIEKAAKGEALPKCQDLPEEAFLDVVALSEAEVHTLSVVSVSYCWLTGDHPDPNCYHLQTLAAVLRRFVNGSFDTAADEYRIPSLGQSSIITRKNTLKERGCCFGAGDGRPVGIFMDWCSVPQDKPVPAISSSGASV